MSCSNELTSQAEHACSTTDQVVILPWFRWAVGAASMNGRLLSSPAPESTSRCRQWGPRWSRTNPPNPPSRSAVRAGAARRANPRRLGQARTRTRSRALGHSWCRPKEACPRCRSRARAGFQGGLRKTCFLVLCGVSGICFKSRFGIGTQAGWKEGF